MFGVPEPEASETLSRLLRTELGLNATVPAWQQVVELIPAGVVTEEEDPIKSLCISLTAKIQGLLTTGIDESYKGELLARLTELETFIAQRMKKAAS